MIQLFKKKPATVDLKGRSMNEIIDEIHDTFYTEVDRLLSEAKISMSLETDKQELIDKCVRLKALGFTNTKEVKEAEVEIDRLNNLQRENAIKAELIEAINYFSVKYPIYKFITEDSVKKICDKYGLVYGEIGNYVGTVPDANLKQMEEFSVKEEDACGEIVDTYYYRDGDTSTSLFGYYPVSELESKRIEFYKSEVRYGGSSKIRSFDKCPLEIAAPLKDFDMTNMKIDGYKVSKIEIPDPVVLKPVAFKNKKYYLIVTAWGQEASDELVINHKNN